jgi:hypothetical protein
MKFRTIGERLNYEREKEVWENNTYDYVNLDNDTIVIKSYGLYENLCYDELMED